MSSTVFQRVVAGFSRWKLGQRATVLLLVSVLALESWALSSTDRDFFLPDVFRPLIIGLLALFALTGWITWRWPRRAIRTLALAIVFAVIVLEVRVRLADSGTERVERSNDVLLRYRYRPGYVQRHRDNSAVTVNHLGLMDVEHAIPKPRDVFRIVVLTGSIANDGAIPFQGRFFRRLEQQLAGAVPDGRRVETINVSCEGYNTVQQVRLLERVGLQYEPDLVVVAYMLSAASLQNGGYRRFGNSFFLFRFLPALERAATGSQCAIFAPFHERYSFDLIVRNSFERLAMLAREHRFRTLIAVLPVVERFDDPLCASIYDQVVAVARQSGLPAVRVADSFLGEPASRFAKQGEQDDICHPNATGHERIATSIAAALRPMLAAPTRPLAQGPSS